MARRLHQSLWPSKLKSFHSPTGVSGGFDSDNAVGEQLNEVYDDLLSAKSTF